MESDQVLRDRARKRAEAKVGFYIHLTIYAAVNLMLFAIWYLTGGGFPWFLIIMLFWGIGVVANAISVYGGSRYMESMTDIEYEKLKNRK
jgi:hypothetical protein